MRKLVPADNSKDAPREIYLEWSVLPDGTDPVLENAYFTDSETVSRPVRYIRADAININDI
jgi:hypothetical protein